MVVAEEFLNQKAINEFGRLPVFPLPTGIQAVGVTQRDWLATLALQGMAAKGLEVQADRAMSQVERDLEMARRAYGLADAMLTVRAQKPKPQPAKSGPGH